MVEITLLYECFFVRRYKTIRQHALLQNLVKWAFGTLQNRPLQLSLAVDLNDIKVLTAISLVIIWAKLSGKGQMQDSLTLSVHRRITWELSLTNVAFTTC